MQSPTNKLRLYLYLLALQARPGYLLDVIHDLVTMQLTILLVFVIIFHDVMYSQSFMTTVVLFGGSLSAAIIFYKIVGRLRRPAVQAHWITNNQNNAHPF